MTAGLRDTLAKLSAMDPSVPKEGLGDSYNNWGSGDMLNAPGGTLNRSSAMATPLVHFLWGGVWAALSPNQPTDHLLS